MRERPPFCGRVIPKKMIGRRLDAVQIEIVEPRTQLADTSLDLHSRRCAHPNASWAREERAGRESRTRRASRYPGTVPRSRYTVPARTAFTTPSLAIYALISVPRYSSDCRRSIHNSNNCRNVLPERRNAPQIQFVSGFPVFTWMPRTRPSEEMVTASKRHGSGTSKSRNDGSG